LAATNGEYFRVGIGKHVIHRSLGVMEGHGASGWIGYAAFLPLYFVTFFASFFPWSIWAPGAFKKGAGEDLPFYLLTQAAVVFAVFTLAATKLPHYTLPAFPCLALWLSFHLDSVRLRRGVAVQAALLVVALFGFWWFNRHLLAASLWREAGPRIRPATHVASVDFHEPSLVWEFRRVSTNDVDFIELSGAQFFWRQRGPRCLIIPTRDFDMGQFAPLGNATIKRVTGTDTASFRRWDVMVLTRP
jgi:4-amino-4-deoxy-L-arabinose transferase-like glycosyltransferase